MNLRRRSTATHRTSSRSMARLGHTLAVTAMVVASFNVVGAGSDPTVSAAAGSVVAVSPTRLLETRIGAGLRTVDGQSQGDGRVDAGAVREVVVRGRGGIAAGAVSVFLNVAAVDPSGPGFITVYPCGTTRPEASTVNYSGGDVVNNAVLAKLGSGGKVCVYSMRSTDVVIDATGYGLSSTDIAAVSPARVFESRPGQPTIDGADEGAGRLGAGTTTSLVVRGRGGVASNAAAVFLNVVVVDPDGPGFASVFPCGSPVPTASTINYAPHDVIGNAAMVKVGTGGKVCVFTLSATDVAIDVTGYSLSAGAVVGTAPARLLETRAAANRPPTDAMQVSGGSGPEACRSSSPSGAVASPPMRVRCSSTCWQSRRPVPDS